MSDKYKTKQPKTLKNTNPDCVNYAGNRTIGKKFIKFSDIISNGFMPFLILAILGFGIYFQSLSYGITGLDDQKTLPNAVKIGGIKNAAEAFRTDVFLSYNSGSFYRPVTGLSYILDIEFDKTGYLYMHLTNLMIHIITCCLLFYLLTIINTDKKISLIFSGIFIVHPLFNQSVIWIVARGDLLAAMFGLISFITFIKFLKNNKIRWYICHILSFSLSVFSKELALLFPLIFIIYYILTYRNYKDKFKIINVITIVLWLAVIFFYLFLRNRVINVQLEDEKYGIAQFIHNMPILAEFIFKFFIPFNLSVLPLFNQTLTISGILIIGIMIYITIKNKAFNKFTLLFLFWYFAFTAATMFHRHEHLNFGYDYLEHRSYLPLIGIIIIITSFEFLKKYYYYTLSIGITIIVIFSLFTISHSKVFENPDKFYSSAIDNGTGVALAFLNRGTFRAESGDIYSAITDYNDAIKINNSYAEAYNNRGNAKIKTGDVAGAISDFNKAIKNRKSYANAYYNRGTAKIKLSDLDGAVLDFDTTISISNNYTDAYISRGNIFLELKKYNEAYKDFLIVLKLEPNNFLNFDNIGVYYFSTGNYNEAKIYFQKAIDVNPEFAVAYKNLGTSEYYLKDTKSACEDWKKASSLGNQEASGLIKQFCK